MYLNGLKINKKKKTLRVRVGRGIGSGMGKTAGRGENGQRARSGGRKPPWFEGGQQRMTQTIPKSGFTNIFKKKYAIVNLGALEKVFETGAEVNAGALHEKGIIKGKGILLKVLGNGELSKALKVTADKISVSAAEKIRKAGGTAEEITK